MFEHNGNSGYVLKPQVLWNKQHPEFGKFNPFEKKKDSDYLALNLKLISGQYLYENKSQAYNMPSGHHRYAVDALQSASVYVEIEVIGIQCDCVKEKTRLSNKNALNPMWNEDFNFHVILNKTFWKTFFYFYFLC